MRRALLVAAALWPALALAGPSAGVPSPEAPGAEMPAGQGADRGAGRPACRLAEREIPIGAGPLHVGTQTYPQTLALGEREVVLSFDDGPWPRTTPAVLAALRAAGVHATFFLIGRNAAAHPSLVRQEVEAGHSVGHHSMTHPAATLRGLDEAEAARDIDDGIAADERAAYGGGPSPEHPRVRFFRFPGFADTPALLGHLDERRIAVFGTDLWAADWLMMTPDAERARVLRLLAHRPQHNGIILFHDTKAQTAAMLPALLADLCREGYRVAHLVPRADAAPPALFAPPHWHSETAAILERMHLRMHLPTSPPTSPRDDGRHAGAAAPIDAVPAQGPAQEPAEEPAGRARP